MKIKDRIKPKVPPLEPGVYMAVCIGFIDIGEQRTEWQGKPDYKNKCLYLWEIPGETVEVNGEQKPRQLSKEFAFSVDAKSSMRKFLESWNGKTYSEEELGEFDPYDMIGKPCQICVALNAAGTYVNVDNIMAIPRGFPAPVSSAEHIKFDVRDWNDEVFGALPEWIQEKIKKSTQYQKEHAPATTVEVKASAASGECPI